MVKIEVSKFNEFKNKNFRELEIGKYRVVNKN